MRFLLPFFASSLPICLVYDDTELYFPLFRYLVSTTFFTKKIDIFFNLLGLLFLPFLATFLVHGVIRKVLQALIGVCFVFSFVFFGFYYVSDPAISAKENIAKQEAFLQLSE